jgi:hypothetical protein
MSVFKSPYRIRTAQSAKWHGPAPSPKRNQRSITWDESVDADVANGGEHIAAVLVGPHVRPGFRSATTYQHQSLLRLLLDSLRVSDLPGASAGAPSMATSFNRLLSREESSNALAPHLTPVEFKMATASSPAARRLWALPEAGNRLCCRRLFLLRQQMWCRNRSRQTTCRPAACSSSSWD